MTKFSAEEITLCKQLHESGVKREIVRGDWCIDQIGEIYLCGRVEEWNSKRPGLENAIAYELSPEPVEEDDIVVLDDMSPYIFLWQIHDCLEWLMGRGYWVRLDTDQERNAMLHTFHNDLSFEKWTDYPCYTASTPLEALLKTIIAIVKEEG